MTPPPFPLVTLPITLIPESDSIHLVGGEDIRLTLTARKIQHWLPPLLQECKGQKPLTEVLDAVPVDDRLHAERILKRLFSERILIDGSLLARHPARSYQIKTCGDGELVTHVAKVAEAGEPTMAVFCQDWLRYDDALTFARQRRAMNEPWIWASMGPWQRAFVGPVFLPNAGPCFKCLLTQFQRRSPAPDFYELLQNSSQWQLPAPGSIGPEAMGLVAQLVAAKVRGFGKEPQPSMIYRLHVLEIATMEVSAHRLLADSFCPECRRGRLGV